MKRMLLLGLATLFMGAVTHAQVRNSTEVEQFIKKYEERGSYVEMSRAYLESLPLHSELTRVQIEAIMRTGSRPSSKSVLLSFKSLTLPTAYWEELLKAIEKDKFERQTFSRAQELLSAQYARPYENKMDCILVNKTSKEVSIIFMTGQDIDVTDFLGYLQVIKKYSSYYQSIED